MGRSAHLFKRLGLFLAQGLVTAMGGRIWFESSEGEGSRFAFELPAARV